MGSVSRCPFLAVSCHNSRSRIPIEGGDRPWQTAESTRHCGGHACPTPQSTASASCTGTGSRRLATGLLIVLRAPLAPAVEAVVLEVGTPEGRRHRNIHVVQLQLRPVSGQRLCDDDGGSAVAREGHQLHVRVAPARKDAM